MRLWNASRDADLGKDRHVNERPMPPVQQRDLRLDFFRGLALWLIFIDHIPTNVLNRVTIRNYGFSDAAEIFVFISGYAAAIAYSRAMREQGFPVAAARILVRASQLYFAFVLLLVFYFAQVAHLAKTFHNPLFAEEMNALELMRQPEVVLPHALMLKFNLANMDILPVYIVLLMFFPPVLWLLLRAPSLAVAASVALYVVAGHFGWYLVAYPQGYWVINPFHWQLLFVFGAWCAVGGNERLASVIRSPITLTLAIGYLAFALLIVLTWHYPRFAALKPGWLHDFLYPIDKTNLDPLRFAHLLAYVVVVARFVPRGWTGFHSPLAWPVVVCGRNSLEIFCVGVFLSFVGHVVITEFSAGRLMQVAVSVLGILIMVALAAWLEWLKELDRRYGPGPFRSNADISGGYA
jgi:hypothetical protein